MHRQPLRASISSYPSSVLVRLHQYAFCQGKGSSYFSTWHARAASAPFPHAAPQKISSTPLRIMPLGGSVTFGVGSSHGNGYRQDLYNLLVSAGYQVDMVGSRSSGVMRMNNNEGWRGFRIDQIETKAMRSVAKCLPNVFTINAGSNDCIQDFDLRHAGERMSNMVEKLWVASPGSTIILSTLLKNSDVVVNSRVQIVNEQFRELAQAKLLQGKRMVLVDMACDAGPQPCDLVDGTHPNDFGYRQMAELWFEGIQIAIRLRFLQPPPET